MALFDFLFKGSKSEKEKKPESGKTTPGVTPQNLTAIRTAPVGSKIQVAPKPAAAAPRPSGTVKLTPTPRPAAPAKPVSAPQPVKPAAPAPETAAKAPPEEAASGDLDSIVSALQQIEQLIADEEGAESKSGRDRNMTPVTLKLAEVAKFAAPLFAPNVQIPADAMAEIYIKDLFSQLSRGRVHTSLKQIAQDIPAEFLRADIEQLEDKEIAVPLPLVVSALDPMELKKRTSSVAKEAKVDNIPTLFTPAKPIPTAPPKPEPKQAPPAAARPAAAVGATPQKPAVPLEPKPAPAPSAPPKPAAAPVVQKAEQAQPAAAVKKPPEPVTAPKPPAPTVKAEPTPPVAVPKAEPVVQPKAAPAPAEPVKEVAKPAPPPVEPKAPVAATPAPAAAKPEAPKPVTHPPAPAAAPAAPAQQVAAPPTPTPLKLKKEPVAPAAAVKAQPVETKPPVVPPAKPPEEKPVAAKPIAEAVKPEAKAPAAPAVPAAPVTPPEPKKVAAPAVPVSAAAKVETPPSAPQKPGPTVQPSPPVAPPPPAMAPGKITDMLLGLAKAQPEAPPPVAKTVPETPKAVTPTAPPPPPKPEVLEAKPTSPPVTPAAPPAPAPRKPAVKETAAAKPAMPTPVPSIAGTGRVPPLMHRGIDLNTATPEEITARLEGIGRAMAERIVEDRTKNGPFYALYDLARVDGIGARLFERITGWKWHEDLYGQLNVVNQVLDKWDGGLPNLNLVAQRFNVISGFDACVVLHRDGHLLASSWDEKSSQAMEAMGPQIIKRVEQYIKNVCAEDMLSVTVFLHERVLILSQHEDIIFVGIRSPRAFNRRHLQVVQGMAMALGKRFSGLRDAAAEATSPSA